MVRHKYKIGDNPYIRTGMYNDALDGHHPRDADDVANADVMPINGYSHKFD